MKFQPQDAPIFRPSANVDKDDSEREARLFDSQFGLKSKRCLCKQREKPGFFLTSPRFPRRPPSRPRMDIQKLR